MPWTRTEFLETLLELRSRVNGFPGSYDVNFDARVWSNMRIPATPSKIQDEMNLLDFIAGAFVVRAMKQFPDTVDRWAHPYTEVLISMGNFANDVADAQVEIRTIDGRSNLDSEVENKEERSNFELIQHLGRR